MEAMGYLGTRLVGVVRVDVPPGLGARRDHLATDGCISQV